MRARPHPEPPQSARIEGRMAGLSELPTDMAADSFTGCAGQE
jgi:hypothetical protein